MIEVSSKVLFLATHRQLQYKFSQSKLFAFVVKILLPLVMTKSFVLFPENESFFHRFIFAFQNSISLAQSYSLDSIFSNSLLIFSSLGFPLSCSHVPFFKTAKLFESQPLGDGVYKRWDVFHHGRSSSK